MLKSTEFDSPLAMIVAQVGFLPADDPRSIKFNEEAKQRDAAEALLVPSKEEMAEKSVSLSREDYIAWFDRVNNWSTLDVGSTPNA